MVLIVDDEVFALDMINRKLTGSGFEFITCSTVAQAKEVIKENSNIKIVVTDLHMSGEDGFDLLIWLTSEYPKIKKVVMSAHSHEDIMTSNNEMIQVDERLRKPVDIKNELIPILIKLLKEV